jgi:hypothetical protein
MIATDRRSRQPGRRLPRHPPTERDVRKDNSLAKARRNRVPQHLAPGVRTTFPVERDVSGRKGFAVAGIVAGLARASTADHVLHWAAAESQLHLQPGDEAAGVRRTGTLPHRH